MHADSTFTEVVDFKITRRRAAGAVAWRNSVRDLIASEKFDLKDMEKLEELCAGDANALRILARMQRRKTERIVELTQLLEYRSPEDKKRGVDAPAREEPLYPILPKE